MPRRLPVRPAKVFGNLFVLIVLCLMSLIYYTNVFVVWIPRAKDDTRVIALLVCYNFFFFMLVWSFFQAMTTDPGQVPVFWGFHLGDNENKRRRYCLMCNVFKPERCHHCSACNRCVLNMDHHCPWINNCVGFWNRKYFMLLLIYVLIMTYFTFFSMAYDFYHAIKWGFEHKFIGKDDPALSHNIIIMVAFLLDFIVAGLMTGFLKFHVMLASDNKTTIENLDKLGRPFNSPYDIGSRANWKQIFGTNPFLWPFPIFCGSGKPIGDGIYWPTPQSEAELKKLNKQNNGDQQLMVSPAQAAAGSTSATSQGTKNSGQNPLLNQNYKQQGVIQYNNNALNAKEDLNQRIFQNKGRAYQLQQQMNSNQNFQQHNQSSAQSQNARGGQAHNQSQSSNQKGGISSGQIMQKKKRAPPGGIQNQQQQNFGTHQPQRFQNNNQQRR